LAKFLHFPPGKLQNTKYVPPEFSRLDMAEPAKTSFIRRPVNLAITLGLACLLFLAATIYGCYVIASKTYGQIESQVGDPKFAAEVTRTMISISDPPPAKFAYRGALDMLFTKVVILAKEEHFIILVQARQSHPNRTLKQAIANGTDYGPLSGKSFEGESEGEMPVGNGTMEYQLGNFTATGGGSDFKGMLGLLKNSHGEPRVLIESFDRTRPFDFASTKKFLDGISKVN
jgi:hypothetical protein